MEFESLYKSYFKEVWLFVRSLSVDEMLAEEIVQETFFKALKSIDRFDGSKDIRAWLFTIARNTYFSYCKKSGRVVANEEILVSVPDSSLSVAELFDDNETAFRIHQFLHTMPEPYKEVFSLRVFGELPFEKIGKLFGKSDGWARVTYYRAKGKIQKYLEDCHGKQD